MFPSRIATSFCSRRVWKGRLLQNPVLRLATAKEATRPRPTSSSRQLTNCGNSGNRLTSRGRSHQRRVRCCTSSLLTAAWNKFIMICLKFNTKSPCSMANRTFQRKSMACSLSIPFCWSFWLVAVFSGACSSENSKMHLVHFISSRSYWLGRKRPATHARRDSVSLLLPHRYAMNLLATVLQTAYLYAYLGAGEGPEIVDAVAELLQATFTTIVNFVLLALACGWTLTESSTGAAGFMVALRDPGSLISWVEVGGVPLPVVTAAPSALLVLFLTSLFVVLEVFDVATSSREHSSGKFHDHESTAGTVLMIVQVLFCALFLYSVTSTMPLVNPRQRDFLVTLGVTGALWFMVTPTLVVVSVVMPKVLRHRLVTGGAMALQSTALCLMCRLFLTRSSDYYKISSIANAGTLVGINMNSPTKAPEKSKYTD
eukprot:m.126023 g.126023  ORF g.126023 m.126023 type:complete len:428 (+) comp13557_c0_seq8:646-1929(+)